MPYPSNQEKREALLCLIYYRGGSDHEMVPLDTYDPLAEFFRLTEAERLQPHSDGSGRSDWHIQIQHAREKLVKSKWIDNSAYGKWRLTTKGVQEARRLAEGNSYFSRLGSPISHFLPEAPKDLRPTAQGFLRDCAVRRAVELTAMDAAIRYYKKKLKFKDIDDTSDKKPYDLCCHTDTEEVRVEVKGSQGDGAEVNLTAGEVEHARSSGIRTDLFVWGHIQIVADEEGPRGVGGRLVCHIVGWNPSDRDLRPTQYRYLVPAQDGSPS